MLACLDNAAAFWWLTNDSFNKLYSDVKPWFLSMNADTIQFGIISSGGVTMLKCSDALMWQQTRSGSKTWDAKYNWHIWNYGFVFIKSLFLIPPRKRKSLKVLIFTGQMFFLLTILSPPSELFQVSLLNIDSKQCKSDFYVPEMYCTCPCIMVHVWEVCICV